MISFKNITCTEIYFQQESEEYVQDGALKGNNHFLLREPHEEDV
jgi:hypothetical protein